MDLSVPTKRRSYDIESLIGDKTTDRVRKCGGQENDRETSGFPDRAKIQDSGETRKINRSNSLSRIVLLITCRQ